jgi:hypothetical protein
MMHILPLSMSKYQEEGIWAFDIVERELVLVFPTVLSLLGDNPMQSEFACHIGSNGKYFCRVCDVKGKDAADNVNETDNPNQASTSQATIAVGPMSRDPGAAARLDLDPGAAIQSIGQIVEPASSGTSGGESDSSVAKGRGRKRKAAEKGEKVEPMVSMIDRIKRFMKVRPAQQHKTVFPNLRSCI